MPLDLRLRCVGELQAIRRAGPWPAHASLEAYVLATDRAVREARRTQDVEVRWNTRFPLWEHHDHPQVRRNTIRLMARRRKAIEIAEEREWLLRMLIAEPRGRA
jgi:hypothetical protein